MRQKLLEYLKENGLVYKENDDLIRFNVNDLHFVCQFFPNDPYFFRIILPCADNIHQEGIRDIIAKMNNSYKVAKVIEVDNAPWIVGESFAYSNQNGELLIARLIQLLTEVFEAYKDERLRTVQNR